MLRTEQVETLLKTQEPPQNVPKSVNVAMSGPPQTASPANLNLSNAPIHLTGDHNMDQQWNFTNKSPQQGVIEDFNFNASMDMGMNNVGGTFTWEMIGLGLEEPLPPQDTIDELHQIYFEKVHPSIPMIHKYRYLAAMNLYVGPFTVEILKWLISFPQRPESAAACLSAICHVDSCMYDHRQVYGPKRPLLPKSA
jgi:hypothetical protein